MRCIIGSVPVRVETRFRTDTRGLRTNPSPDKFLDDTMPSEAANLAFKRFADNGIRAQPGIGKWEALNRVKGTV